MKRSKPTMTDRNTAATRKLLLEAGAQAFARYGFHGAKIAAIAREAQVANGTFYLHFKDKDALARELEREAITLLGRRLTAAHHSSPDAALQNRAEIEVLVDFVDENRTLMAALLSGGGPSQALDALVAQREREIRAAQRAGEYRTDLIAIVAARAEVGMLREVLLWWIDGNSGVERNAVVHTLLTMRREGTRPLRQSKKSR
jgi:AcrR family transcriptional regulator